MSKEPKNWWVKQVIVALIPIAIFLIYGWIKKVNWYSLIVKWYSGWIVFIIFVAIWFILEYRRKQKERRKREGSSDASSGKRSIFGTFEEHEGK